MEDKVCKKYRSNKLIERAQIVDYRYMNQMNDLSIHIKTTDKIFFNKYEKGKLRAELYGSYGNVELSINNPHEL